MVAATILPEAAHVAEAWKKWYRCGKKVRQLRFIRHHLEKKLQLEQEKEEIYVEEESPIEKTGDAPVETGEAKSTDVESQENIEDELAEQANLISSQSAKSPSNSNGAAVNFLTDPADNSSHTDDSFKFRYESFDILEYARMVGLADEAELEELFTDFGVEQLSVFAREISQR